MDQVVFADEFTASSPGLSVTLQYDAAGNLTDDGLFNYVYDAWNRLVEVKRKVVSGTAPTIATYRYDGLGRRIHKKVEHSGDRNRTEFFYYNNQWQLLEVRNEDDKATRQFVWGTQYIDEAVCMDVDTDTSGEGYGNCTDAGSKRYFYCQDANWNVIALREGSTITERYEYDPYGECRVLKGYSSAENQEDLTVTGDSLAGNPIRYAGYFFDDETQLYYVRNRYLDPRLGRWRQTDPLGYLDGMNRYEYVGSQPVQVVDPMGTVSHKECLEAAARAKEAYKPEIKQMKEKGCKEPEIECICCKGDRSKGDHFDILKTKNVIMCEDTWPDSKTLESAIKHELVHAFDDCMCADWRDCGHRACSEVRAMSESGQCDGEWRLPGETREQCVRRNAAIAVEADPKCKPGWLLVATVFKQCYVGKAGGPLPPWPYPPPKSCGSAPSTRPTTSCCPGGGLR